MEDSKRFAQTYIQSEGGAAPGSGDAVQFNIATVYVPEPVVVPEPAPVARTKIPLRMPPAVPNKGSKH
jgi:hypothetical protein